MRAAIPSHRDTHNATVATARGPPTSAPARSSAPGAGTDGPGGVKGTSARTAPSEPSHGKPHG